MAKMTDELDDIATTGLLTQKQVIERLSFAFPQGATTPGIFLARLIARGALKAVQFGQQGAVVPPFADPNSMLRVRLEDFKSFLASNGQSFGAIRQDFNIPPETMAPIFPLDGYWFTNPWIYEVDKLRSAMMNQLGAQLEAVVKNAPVKNRGDYVKPISPEIDKLVLQLGTQLMYRNPAPIVAEVPITPEFQQLIDTPADGPAPGSFLTMQRTTPSTSSFLNMTEVFLASGLQGSAKDYLQAGARANLSDLKPEDARVLYQSPQDYQRIRDAAMETFLSRASIVASQRVAFSILDFTPVPSYPGGQQPDVLVQLFISNRGVMQAAHSNEARLAALAF